MRDPYDSLARALAMAETPEERAAVGAALARHYAGVVLAGERGAETVAGESKATRANRARITSQM